MNSFTHIASVQCMSPSVLGLCRGLPVLITVTNGHRNNITFWNAAQSSNNTQVTTLRTYT